jgi:squalene cyclase
MQNQEMAIQQFLVDSANFVTSHPEEWSLDYDVEMETLNHLLRVRIQEGAAERYSSLFQDLCSIQHDDGGWGDTRDEKESKLRTTSFSTQMVLRANRILRDSELKRSIERGLAFIVEHQEQDGSWLDPGWPVWDATSVSVGTLIFAANEPWGKEIYLSALTEGIAFIVENQRPGGGWYSKATSYPIDTTAHLLQKCLLVDVSGERIERALQFLLQAQDQAGHWDKSNVDHTCDAVRSLMLAASHKAAAQYIAEIERASEKAIKWLMDCVVDGGLGSHPGVKPDVLFTCDGIDTALKYLAFKAERRRKFMADFYR